MSIFFSVENLDVEDIVLTPADEAMLNQIEDDHLPPTQIESSDEEMEEGQLEDFPLLTPNYSHICDFDDPAEKLTGILEDMNQVEEDNGPFATYELWLGYVLTNYEYCCDDDQARIMALLPQPELLEFDSVKSKLNVVKNFKEDHVYEMIE